MTRLYACEAFVTAEEVFDASCSCTLNPDDDTAFVEALIDQASDILVILSGFRIRGVCTVTVRPISHSWCGQPWDVYSPERYLRFGVETIPLRGPNTTVNAITIDGQLVAASDYSLINGLYLLRHSQLWPTSNDLTKPNGQVGTWTINYSFGDPPDHITKQACIALVCDLATEIIGDDNMLPQGTRSVNLQGVSVSLEDRAAAFREGVQQLEAVNRFMGIYAPLGRFTSGVYAPESDHGWTLVERS